MSQLDPGGPAEPQAIDFSAVADRAEVWRVAAGMLSRQFGKEFEPMDVLSLIDYLSGDGNE